ncbi:hypothetical protein D3C87_1966180 [compost metagenome]
MIVHVPGMAPQRHTVAGGQIDILPTLAGLFDLDFPIAFGQDLLQGPDGFVALKDGSYLPGTSQEADDVRWRQHQQLNARILSANLVPALRDRLGRVSSR